MSLRLAQEADLDAMVALAAAKRVQYQAYQPVFHRAAPDADSKQRLFLKDQLSRPEALLLANESDGRLNGWLYLRLVKAPPVYEPGGQLGAVDDFVVADDRLWPSVGRALLEHAMAWSKERGAVLINVVCGPQDAPKRALLAGLGLSVASEWQVKAL